MPTRWASALSCAAWLAASAALAQPVSDPTTKATPSTTVSPVTVQSAPTPRTIQKQANSFVKSYAATPNPNIGQIGRWHDPVCIQIWGLPLAAQAAKIKARMESMAQAVGLPPARPGCKINVEIVFTDQPQEPILGYDHRDKMAKLKTFNHPIQAWYVTGTESDGLDVEELMSIPGLRSLLPPSNRVADDPENIPPAGCTNRFTACYKSEFSNVFIVADNKALDGANLRLIADDMAMLALSQPRSLDGCNALPSVIDRFALSPCPGRDPPTGLTPADAAYLEALYSADPEGKKFVEYAAIGERMANILIKGDAIAAAGAGSTVH
jgi:hypothetical protein